MAYIPSADFWGIAFLYALLTYLYGHQGSHLAAVGRGEASLNPVLSLIMLAYNWLFLNYLFLIWYGYKTVWGYALGVFAVGLIIRLVFIKMEILIGLTKGAWAISLIGIPGIPFIIFAMVDITLASTETSGLFEACRRCP